MKGGESSNVGQVEESALPEHSHAAQGHSHTDAGHSHEDKGHTHEMAAKTTIRVLKNGGAYGDGDGSPRWAMDGFYGKSVAGTMKAQIQQGKTNYACMQFAEINYLMHHLFFRNGYALHEQG